MATLENERLRMRARVKEWEEGERMTKFLFQKIRTRGRNNLIESLEGEGGLISDKEGLLKVAFGFYSKLYRSVEDQFSKTSVEEARSKFLNYLQSTISREHAAMLDEPLTQEELWDAQ